MQRPLVTADDIRNILVYNGKLYWISAYGLYTRNANGTITELYINDGSEIILGGAGGTEMVGVDGKVAVFAASENKILFHDLSKSATNILRLYFMCESGCSLPSWTIVSMPLGGGTPVPEFELGGIPVEWIQKDGIFYVAWGWNGGGKELHAINLELKDSCRLLVGVRDDMEIEVFSSGWLYILEHTVQWLSRYSLNGCVVGQGGLHALDVITIHSDDSNLYYFIYGNGLKREPPSSPADLLFDARLIPAKSDITSGEMGKKKTMSMPQLKLLLGD